MTEEPEPYTKGKGFPVRKVFEWAALATGSAAAAVGIVTGSAELAPLAGLAMATAYLLKP